MSLSDCRLLVFDFTVQSIRLFLTIAAVINEILTKPNEAFYYTSGIMSGCLGV